MAPLLQSQRAAQARLDSRGGIAPVAGVMETPVLVVATPAFDRRDFDALIGAARRVPAHVRWVTSG